MRPWAAGVLMLALGVSLPAAADRPAKLDQFEGCIADGFMLTGDGNERRLKFDNNPDWSAFDGKVVLIRRLWASRVNRLAEPPIVTGPCRPDVLALSRARVAAFRGIFDLIHNGRPSEGLAVVVRAAATAPDDCLLLAARVYALERTGNRLEAKVADARATTLNCAPEVYGRRLNQFRTNREPWLR